MIIGIPKEIKTYENRVGATPAGVSELVKHGHTVWVEQQAGLGSGFTDEDYVQAGAEILESAEEVWSANMVMKVKEPLAEEYDFFRDDLLLFTYLHLAAEAPLTAALLKSKTTAIAYETVQLANMAATATSRIHRGRQDALRNLFGFIDSLSSPCLPLLGRPDSRSTPWL